MRPRSGPIALAAALSICRILSAREAIAETPPAPAVPRRAVDPNEVSGVDRLASSPGDYARSIASAALWIPRQALDLAFLATGAAAGVVVDQQVVPRVTELLKPAPGKLILFP